MTEGDDPNPGNSWPAEDERPPDVDGNTLPGNSVSGDKQTGNALAGQADRGNLGTGHPTQATSAEASTPYDALTPDAILDALESAGFEPNGSLLALNSFENRVYQIGLADDSFVVSKFYRPSRWSSEQILEEHAFTHELLAAELSVVAPLSRDGTTLFEHNDFQFAVFSRQGGHPPEIESEHNLAIMGRTLGRLHAVGAADSHTLRPQLDWQRMAAQSREWLLNSNFIPDELLPAYDSVSEHLVRGVETIMNRPARPIRLHGDCHLGNVLWLSLIHI